MTTAAERELAQYRAGEITLEELNRIWRARQWEENPAGPVPTNPADVYRRAEDMDPFAPGTWGEVWGMQLVGLLTWQEYWYLIKDPDTPDPNPDPENTVKASAVINTAFDFRTDCGRGDPDTHSATLRRYHRLLWSKPLPGGATFDLDDTTRGVYLHHSALLGEFFLASDSAIPTFTRWKRMQHIVTQLPEAENEAFRTIGYTIGGMLLFPGNRICGQATINVAKGFDYRIRDRIDLTLECIRRHYQCEDSPLGGTLLRYRDFFSLFVDFSGYVEFFLLQDLVTGDAGRVSFLMPFDNFTTPALPRDLETYKEYRRLTIEFVKARNGRIDQWAVEHLQ